MRIGEICTTNPVSCAPDTSIAEAAKLMRQHHVGDLLVTVEDADGIRLIGILTDRDIIVEVIALGIPLDRVTVKDIMSRDVAHVEESKGVYETLALMRHKGIRRMPVVNQDDRLIGIVTLDDLLENIAEEMGLAAKLITQEREREEGSRAVAAPGSPARR